MVVVVGERTFETFVRKTGASVKFTIAGLVVPAKNVLLTTTLNSTGQTLPNHMTAEIIAIGSELTCGSRLDTNSQWLSRELEALGWTVHRHTTVADDLPSMVRMCREAAQRSRIVLITGGLGPTLDDITREMLAEAFDQPLVEDPQALQHIQSLFQSRGREMPERNRVQALKPRDAITIHNAHGTAPGILMHLSQPECTIGVMPGVPAEMKLMFREQLVSRLPRSTVFVSRKVIRTFGYGESDAERLLGDLTARGRNPEVGITASQAVISLSITARAGSQHECELLSHGVRDQSLDRLGDAVFGEEDVELHTVTANLLHQRKLKIALLEGTSTGGQIGQWLTESDDWAHQLVFSQILPDTASPDPSSDWSLSLRERSFQLMQTGSADFVILTSPSRVVTDKQGIRVQAGEVLLLGPNLDRRQDVSMAGNLAIFRSRAARCALNLLRLHLTNASRIS